MTLYEWSFHLPCTMNDVTAVEVDVVATQESPGGGSCSASSFLELTSEGGVLVPRGATYAPVGDSIELLIENAITAPSPVGVGEGKSSQSTGPPVYLAHRQPSPRFPFPLPVRRKTDSIRPAVVAEGCNESPHSEKVSARRLHWRRESRRSPLCAQARAERRRAMASSAAGDQVRSVGSPGR